MAKRILVVDDEQSMRETLTIMLEKEGFTIVMAKNGDEALEKLDSGEVDIILTDLKMPGLSGIQFIEALTAKTKTPIIIMTAYATKDEAIQALNLGASFFVEKPFKKPELMNYINNAIKIEELIQENRNLRAGSRSYTLDMMIGTSPELTRVKELIRKVADTDSSVLITGESGTGKEMAARALHNLSNRSDGPFIAINCGAIPSELLESELFGHKKGSFTGAVANKTGLMVQAGGGTFFLDEVGNTSPAVQMKLLRALQEREVLPVGANAPEKIDIRILTATNENLEEAVSRNTFRKDLFYRLNVINIHIPPLREREGDIELLFRHFLEKKDKSGKILKRGVPGDIMKVLLYYDWPGNIRELENVVERLVALSHNGKIKFDMLPDHVKKPKAPRLVSEQTSQIPSMDDIEKAYIHWVLTQYDGQKQKASEVLGIGRSTLDRKIEKYGL